MNHLFFKTGLADFLSVSLKSIENCHILKSLDTMSGTVL